MSREKTTNRQAIVHAAARLFEERGYKNTTIDDVAKEVGVSKPTVYARVDSKAALLELIFGEVLDALDAGLERISKLRVDPHAALEEYVRLIVQISIEKRPYVMIFFSDERELDDQTRRNFRRWGRRMSEYAAELVSDGIRAGVIHPEMDTELAGHILSGILGSIYRWFTPKSADEEDQLVSQILLLFTGSTQLGEQFHEPGEDRSFR